MLLKDFIREATDSLEALYPAQEAHRTVLLLCEALLGVRSYTHLVEPGTPIPPEREPVLRDALARLCKAEPLQYVIGQAPFCGYAFRVTPAVLIPRPETECLVQEALRAAGSLQREASRRREPLQVLDLCTGSGCIAWTMALKLGGARVVGVDLSDAALEVARGQDFSRELQECGAAAPRFVRGDVLDPVSGPDEVMRAVRDAASGDSSEGRFDLLLSNPPYIPASQRARMRPNVVDYEPALALFVPDEDPLVFYRAIAAWSRRCLSPRGRGFVEIHEDLGEETLSLFRKNGFPAAVLLPDCFGKNRIIAY